eukprot:CAMPEP_0174252946 /NCGR_PEP_ID=MMETSP0439-20130205/2325_1 /TAXON_ID=0 /ORGANISM="Stereomyxa ramosa, Strain Chinc5" /LENGTH=114 /DNA_ID=CAMNT_0015333677 /DNA_START=99 /DNA_END=441 /DNA_ORIENTATION=-
MSTKRKTNPVSSDRYDSDDSAIEDSSDEETKTEKKPKKKPAKKEKKEGEWQLSTNRKVTVSKWRNQTKIDIREYYEKDGELKPGRKGISLSIEQWETLRDIMPEVNEYIENFCA